MQNSGTAIRHAAAQVREILIAEAARRLGVPPAMGCSAAEGAVRTADGRALRYGELVADVTLHVEAQAQSRLKDSGAFRYMGRSMPRVDIPAKVTGGAAYVQDLRLPGMVHARVVRPPSPAARLMEVDAAAVEAMPGVMQRRARRQLPGCRRRARMAGGQGDAGAGASPRAGRRRRACRARPSSTRRCRRWFPRTAWSSRRAAPPPAGRVLEATYTRPYQIHGSIGPSCAVALADGGALTVWSHTQGVFPDRERYRGDARACRASAGAHHPHGGRWLLRP